MSAAPATTSRHFIIGTAGHVDHGKTSLIRALTGEETDRLREERERGMSIDLGFAEFQLPSGIRAGVIDVPGHERFLKNMLAGAGGIDLVLLVIAADEGVMPQTREHLDILQILRTQKGLIVLTKVDMVEPEWLELVQEDIRSALRGTFLADAPMVAVSSTTGFGIPELREALDRLAGEVPTRTIVGPWRLPIDRVFTIGGFGTVVTGTLTAGVARVGDRVEVLPERRETRIRGMQVHGTVVDYAEAGTRVAMNLAGLAPDEVHRGCLAAPPGVYEPVTSLDARLEVLPTCSRDIRQRTRVRIYLGTAEVLGRLNLLDAEVLHPGESGLVQIRLESPTQAGRGERYVMRFCSPMETIGGGAVLDAGPRRHRRFNPVVIKTLQLLEKGSPDELVAETVFRAGLTPLQPAALCQQLGLELAAVTPMLERLGERGLIASLENGSLLHRHRLEAAEHLLASTLSEFHVSNPMRRGMSREELRSRVSRQMDPKGFQLVLARMVAAGQVFLTGGKASLGGREPVFDPDQTRAREVLSERLLADPFNAPPYADLASGIPMKVASAVWEAMVENGEVVRIAADVFLHRRAVEDAVARVREYIGSNGSISAAQFRDLVGTSRKYAVPFMEWLDAQKITRRVGDTRELL